MNNSKIKTETPKWFAWAPIGVIILVLGLVGLFVFIAAKRDLTSLENFLLQLIFLSIGCIFSFWVGQRSNRKAAEDILKPHARNAARYLISLYKSVSLARTIASVGLRQQLDLNEVRGALMAFFTGQLIAINDALESWGDILREELEDLIQKLHEEKITPEEFEDYIQNVMYDNTTEDR